MGKNSKVSLLLKGLRKQPEEIRRDYTVNAVNKLSRADLLDIKFQYEATINTTLPWTWIIALYGVLFSLLLQTFSTVENILVPIILFFTTMAAACFLSIQLYRVFCGQRYLLGYINKRLEELDSKKK